MRSNTPSRAALPTLAGVVVGAIVGAGATVYAARESRSAALASTGIQVRETKGIDQPTRDWAIHLVNDKVPKSDTLPAIARFPAIYGTGSAMEAGESASGTATVTPAAKAPAHGRP